MTAWIFSGDIADAQAATPAPTNKIMETNNNARDGSPDATCSLSSLTPETDALANKIYARGIRMIEIRMLQHARKMEKERNMARATAKTFRQCAEVTFGVMPFPRKFHWENPD